MAFFGYLKQSTAVTIQLGPFLDEDDGKTAENGLTIEDTDVWLSKNGGALANPNDTDNAANDALGYYTKALDGTDTGTLGILTVVVHESGALPVRQDYQVVPANWWDTMCGADQLDVNVTNVAGTAQTGNDNGADINAILTDTAEIGAAGAGLTAVPWNAAWDAEVESEVDDALGAGGADLTAIPWNAAWDAEVESEVEDAVGADVTAILADTNELQTDDVPGLIAALNDLSAAQVNAEVVDALDTDTYAEPGQGAPAATAPLSDKISYLYKAWRNQIEQTSSTLSLYDDAGSTVDQKATVSDDGTTFTRGEIGTGP